MSKIYDLEIRKENIKKQIVELDINLCGVISEIEEYKNPQNKIRQIISEYSDVLSVRTEENGDIILEVRGYSGDYSLGHIYRELAYHCTWAHIRHNLSDREPVMDLRFTKN